MVTIPAAIRVAVVTTLCYNNVHWTLGWHSELVAWLNNIDSIDFLNLRCPEIRQKYTNIFLIIFFLKKLEINQLFFAFLLPKKSLFFIYVLQTEVLEYLLSAKNSQNKISGVKFQRSFTGPISLRCALHIYWKI